MVAVFGLVSGRFGADQSISTLADEARDPYLPRCVQLVVFKLTISCNKQQRFVDEDEVW